MPQPFVAGLLWQVIAPVDSSSWWYLASLKSIVSAKSVAIFQRWLKSGSTFFVQIESFSQNKDSEIEVLCRQKEAI